MNDRTYTDHIGRKVDIPITPQRVVCLVPSISELIFDLGIESRFVGCTRFCVHPSSLKKDLTIIGGTKKLRMDKIKALNPDLIIANKEENNKEQIEFLSDNYPTWISDISTLEDSYKLISDLGEILNATEIAEEMSSKIKTEFSQLHTNDLPSALYLIWKNPYMAAGSETFIHDILGKVGFKNVLSGNARYPALTEKEIIDLNPKVILLSSEPFPFASKHIEELQKLLPRSKVLLVDGELFSWYGSRLLRSTQYFNALVQTIISY